MSHVAGLRPSEGISEWCGPSLVEYISHAYHMNLYTYLHGSEVGFNPEHKLIPLLWISLELDTLQGNSVSYCLDLGQ